MRNEIKQRINQINNGEIPKGYKKITVGVVPCEENGWTTNDFGMLFDFYGGLGIPRDRLGNIGIPYLHYGDMHRNSFTSVTYDGYLNQPKYATIINENETYLLKDGDIVFLDASEDLEGTSRCVLIKNHENKPFISGLHTFIAKSKGNELSYNFKQYVTSSQSVKKQFMSLAAGFKVYGLNRNSIKNISISYPQNPIEQEKIATILMTWDKAVSLQEKLINKLEEQKNALMQKLLTPKEGWEEIALGNCCSITTGKLDVNAMDENGKYPFFTCAKEHFWINEYAFDMEVILVSGNGANVGYVHYFNGKFNAYQRTYILYNFKHNISFIKFALDKNLKARIDIEKHGGNTPYIVLSTLCEMNIYLPDKKTQQKIANILSKTDENINLQKQKLAKLKEQQKALMQLLLTGIVRV